MSFGLMHSILLRVSWEAVWEVALWCGLRVAGWAGLQAAGHGLGWIVGWDLVRQGRCVCRLRAVC